LPPQKLNPSFQIKLPSLADNRVYIPVIDGGKITYSKVPEESKAPEYKTLSEYARQEFNERILGKKEEEDIRISGWQIADAGLTGINKIAGTRMKLEKRIDENGNMTVYGFNSKLLSFSTTSAGSR
jgi:hypothetical protein